MRIRIICPARAGSRHGNRVTALRWRRMLGALGHRATIEESYSGGACDLLLALHARKSARSIAAFARAHPRAPLLVALTGTDLYRDIGTSRAARRSIELATLLVALQPRAADELPARLRRKVRVVYQSAPRARRQGAARRRSFDVCVIGHLRAVKDPMRAALASRLLPPSSRVRVIHLGKAMTPALEAAARREVVHNPRYAWLGERSPAEVRAALVRSRVMVLSSRLEGGANVVTEALAAGVPILASAIPGTTGLLGGRYPGLFPAGDTRALSALMLRAERDPAFYRRLQRACAARAWLASPALERRTWKRLLAEVRRAAFVDTARVPS